MTQSRKLAVERLVFRVLPLLAFVLALSGIPTARAAVFAPECDESGASAIAPIPVLVHDHGEIRAEGCDPYSALEPLGGVPTDQDRPSVSLETQAQLFIVEAPPEHHIPRAALARCLDPGYELGARDAHRCNVYRPPR
jgi:hypothetical protein